MNHEAQDPPALSPLKRAFLALEDAQARLAAFEAAAREPIAVIGVGCRVPGADNPAAFWNLLREGRDAVGPIPRERFDIDAFFDTDAEASGRIAVREAGFLGPIDSFDAGFFGISPREARGMDPQQRLLLEVAWEALEHAGQAPDRLSASATGVYVGQASSDYMALMHKSGDSALLDAHFTSGVAHSVTSGRVSYLLGLQGPSLTVDTACSSSLVAVHLACQALRARECRMALAGGVNLMLSEDLFIAFSHSRMLAPDGRCKSFDAAADGFGRGEGCGIVVLKRLSDAQADGDRILALIRGSAVNQDGPSSGLTAPNGPAQEAVIREALARAGVAPGDIGVIEAHGTGTQLGDPLEVQALGHVFGPGRDAARPLWLGSVKTNLGHLEAAAGVSGLIKLVLALQQRAIPAHLHFRNPSPHIAWGELPLRVPTALQPWEPIGGRRLAGVSSFGFSGTNAHVVLEEAPTLTSTARADAPAPQLYTLSARDPAALRELARRHADALAAPASITLADACFTANAGRAQFKHRAAISAASLGELRERLVALAEGAQTTGLRVAHVQRRDPPRVAFVFTGQGAQYAGMASGLYDSVPVFRAALDRCAQVIDPRIGRPLLELLFGSDTVLLDRTEFTQPALFAIEFALAETWRAWGVTPSVVIGHSVGEVAAACVAGVMSLDDAAQLICERGRRMGALPEGGAMAAVHAPSDTVTPLLAAHPRVAIAAINAPTQTVISGAAESIDILCQAFEGRGIRCQRLKVSHAFHSPLVEPMLDGFEAALSGIRLAPARLRLVSNLGGGLASPGEITQPRYWRRHVREAVRFADGVATLVAQKPDVCVEIGPQPALLAFIAPAAPGLPLIASLRKGRPDREQLLDALAGLYLEGAEIDWRAVHDGEARMPIAWPTYPFQRERCWFSARPGAAPRAARGAHPLLGMRLRSASVQRIHDGHVSVDAPRWVAQHRVHGQVVLPATAYLDMLLAAAADRHGVATGSVEDVTVQEAMLLGDEAGAGRSVQAIVDAPVDGASLVRLSSLADEADDAQAWTTHVTARLPQADAASAPTLTLAAARAACTEPVDRVAFYAGLAQRGLDFGPAFQSLHRIWRGPGQAVGEVALHAELEAERGAYHFHPVQLDGCLQLLAVALASEADDALYLPLSIGSYRLVTRPAGNCWAHIVAEPAQQGSTRRADLHVFNADGTPVAQLLDLRLKRVDAATLLRLGERAIDDLIHEIVWRDAPAPQAARPLVLGELAGAAREGIVSLHGPAGIAAYDAALPQLDALCAGFVAQAIVRLGWSPSAGKRFDGVALATQLGVVERHRQLFQRLLAILAEQGWLARDGQAWVVRRAFGEARTLPGTTVPAPIAAEQELTERTGRELAAALHGDCDPLQLLFPAGSSDTTERLYRDSPPARLFNGLVAELVAAAVKGRSAARPLRILEIGAGTGGTTAHVLPRLREGAAEYTFTDVGSAFVKRARERFGPEHPLVRFQVLDLEQDPVAQGLAEQGFDLILASNVVHATRDLRRSLERIRRLLAPGGVLAMLEACAPQAWFDLTVGLTEGWWCFDDHHLRPDYPTLPRDAWLRLLGESGFGLVDAVAGDPAQSGVLGLNTLLLGQRDASARDWLVFAEAQGFGQALAARLRARGDGCELVTNDGPPIVNLLHRLHAQGRRWTGVIHAGALDHADGIEATTPALAALQLAQGLVSLGTPTRLWLLTRGAQAAAPADEVTAPRAATLWGLARALRLEHPELGATCVDIDTGTTVDTFMAELDDASAEPERALRGSLRKVARLVRTHRPSATPDDSPAVWRLAPAQPGSLERFVRLPMVQRAPGPGELAITVEATGLNFKDVLNVLGLYPGEAGPLGAECAGRISAIGAGVTGFTIGDPVLAIAAGSFASHVVAPALFVRRRPEGIGAEEGASFAVAHLTAEFCLGHLAGLRAGQSVLIHAAAGGVGLAAVRIAQRAGATVFATAGARWKRELLQGLGVAQVFDSRSPSFAEALLAATGGRGVDVVLNSLAGELIEPSFAVLARGGCFVEIGKRDIKPTEWVAALGRDLRYHVVDWGETAQREPALIGAMLAGLVDSLADGSLAPLPRHSFALADAPRAFRFMAQARHAGRIVLRHPGAPAWQPSSRGSYLVTGGLSGLGLEVARWLGERGAGRLVLVGRRGVTPEAAPVIEALRARGVAVIAEALDVADTAALRALLDRVRADGPPLRGVWHSAGVLDDAALLQQDAARLDHVFAPKVTGAALLDRLTRADALEAFVLFSSVAGVLGSAGQANHSAAGAFLDALAHDRSARALPALAIDWGAWREVGAAADRGIGERLAQQGLSTLSPSQGLAAMQRLIERGTTQAAVLAIDWPTYRARTGRGGHSAFLEELSQPPAPMARATEADATDLPSQLAAAPPTRRRSLLAAFVRERALRSLGLDTGHAVDPRTPLGELGLDSLLAVELRNTLATALRRNLPATLLFDHPTIDALTDHLLREIFPPSPRNEGVAIAPAPASATRIVDSIEELSDDEVERRLSARTRPKS